MKVALIFPRFKYPSGDPPLGLAYLAARLRQRLGVTPLLIDTTFSKDPLGMIESALSAERFDLVGISAMVTMADDALIVARLVKQLQPQAMLIMGGPHPTVLPERVLADPAVDAVAVGEGEDLLADIVEQGSLDNIPGLWTKDGDKLIEPAARAPIPDLDEQAFPALDLLPMDQYLASWFQLDTIQPGLKGTSVLATRGCPFACSYCQPTLDRLFGKKLRKRSPANLADELEWLIEQFGINAFLFADDTFIADKKWVRSFCKELKERELGLIWGCNVRADLADRELFQVMYEVGLRKVYVGIESFSDTVRYEIFNKKIDRQQIARAVDAARQEKINIQGYFMLGAPTETRQDVINTMRYARSLDIDDATFNITTPLPGTYLFDKFREQVTVEPEQMDYYKQLSFKPEGRVDQAFLNRARVGAYVWFYLRPFRLWHMLGLIFGPGGLKKMWLKLARVL